MTAATLRGLERDLGAVLARHERGVDLAAFASWADDPVGFAGEVLGVRLWSAQRDIVESIRDHRQTAALGCQGAGKDFAAACAALWWTFARQGLVVATAATQRQAEGVLHAEIVRLFRGCPDLPGEAYKAALRVPGAGGVVSFVSSESSKATGWHAPLVLGLGTEAQALEPWAFEALRSCAVGPDDRLALMANPLRPSGPLYTAARSGRWNVLTIPASRHPNVREGRAVIPGGPSRAWVEEMSATYGEASPIYVARVEARFPESATDSLYRRSWLDAAAARWRDESWCRQRGARGPIVVSVDPARTGADETAVAVRIGWVIERLVTFHEDDLMRTVERAEDEVAGLGVPKVKIVVDEIGLGAGVLDRLRERGHAVQGFNGARTARESGRFANRRTEAYWALRDLLADHAVALPPDEPLVDELLATPWTVTADGRVALPAKAQISAALGRSPDRADAVTMALAARGPRRFHVW